MPDQVRFLRESSSRAITTTRTYDELDRVTLVDVPGTDLDISYTYDDPLVPFSLARLTQIGRASGNVDYRYDRFGRVTQDGALAYSHDANGNRATITYPGGLVATYTFDHADREVSLTAQPSGGSVQSIASAATYAALGPLTSLTLGNGLTEDRAWMSRYFPQSIELSGAGSTLLRWNYSTDSEGNITAITNPKNAADNRSFGYQDVQYYLTSGTGPWGVLSWSYDQIGNRLTETRDGLTDTYSYVQNAGSNNTAILDQIQLGIGGQRTYQHGPAGHMTQINSAGNVTDLAYNSAGRLSQLHKPATGDKTDFLYDGRSYLVSSEAGVVDGLFFDDFELAVLDCWDSKEEDGVVTVLGKDCQTLVTVPTYSSEGVLHALDKVDGRASVDDVEYFLYFAGRPVAQVTEASGGGVVYEWITTDHLGTPAVVTDAAGVEVWGGGFEPFGRDFSMAASTSLRLPGQWEDGSWAGSGSGVGAYYNVHRWYQGEAGRYSRVDPLGRYGDPNPFAYACGNPLGFVDPLGERSRVCCRPIVEEGFLSRYYHCYIEVEAEPGQKDFDTYGLHRVDRGVGCAYRRDQFDRDGRGDPATECGAWNESCEADRCVREQLSWLAVTLDQVWFSLCESWGPGSQAATRAGLRSSCMS